MAKREMAAVSNMANVRNSDTSLWLHNKLGTSNDLWSGGSICSQFNHDVLKNIKECFIDLQAQVKLKLLLSLLHIPRRNVEEWRVELEEIIEIAMADSDQWVSMLAELLKSYPASGTINVEIEENLSIFTDLVTDLRKQVKKHSDLGMLPMECFYLNKNALNAVVGQQIQPIKHFTLKRKPKSAALRAELLQKSSDAANSLKKNTLTPTVPVRARGLIKKMDDTTPLKGFPSRVASGGFRSPAAGLARLSTTPLSRPIARTPAGRKDGGIKLLEIGEQPMGFGREAKRRKKQAEIDAAEQQKKDKDAPGSASPTANATPDYAAGLSSATITTQLPTPTVNPIASGSAPSYVPAPGTSLLTTSFVPPATTLPGTARESQPMQARIQVVTAMPQTTAASSTSTVIVTQPTPATPPGQATPPSISMQPSTPSTPSTPTTPTPPDTPTTPTPAVHTPPMAQPPKKGLSLTREQMQEAQEMFKTANKVTRPEKALILGFMAGSRENPCPHLGNIITIKLSEDEEIVKQSDGTSQNVLTETHFQMNYTNGEWKRIKKFRKLDAEVAKECDQPVAASA